MFPWWDVEDAEPTINFRYITYRYDGMTVYVGNRPYMYRYGDGSFVATCCNRAFFDQIDVWVSVTDAETLLPPKTNYLWFPWHEPRPVDALVFSSFAAAMNQIHARGEQTIYLHCDAGTHRSPAMFGWWLMDRGITKIAPVAWTGFHNPDEVILRNPITVARACQHERSILS